MIRKVSIIWRACCRLAKFHIGYLILYNAFESHANLVRHFETIGIYVKIVFNFQILEIKSQRAVRAARERNVLAYKEMYIPTARRQRNFHFFELILVAIDISLTRKLAPQQTQITFSVFQKVVGLKNGLQIATKQPIL
jgi:hypothetical protein